MKHPVTNQGPATAGSAARTAPGTDVELSTKLISTLATREDVRMTELDSLSPWIDLEALDALFAPTHGGTERSGGRVSFRYRDQQVTVTSDGWVLIEPWTEDDGRGTDQAEKQGKH